MTVREACLRAGRNAVGPSGAVRVLAVTGLARALGFGFLITVGALYFTRTVGLPAGSVGFGMTAAAACGVAAGVTAGRLADARGPRAVTVAAALLQSGAALGYALADGLPGFLIVTCVSMACHAASEAARGALIALVVQHRERVEIRARLHVVANVGMSLGAVLGGIALLYETDLLYRGFFLLCAALFAVTGILSAGLPDPRTRGRPEDGRRGWDSLGDRRFAAFILLNTVLMMNDGLITVVLPLWIASRTEAPVSVYSAILVLNTAVVVLFQVRASRGTGDLAGAARALRRSGTLLFACCVVFALSAGRSPRQAVAVLLLGALLHVIGEMLCSAGAWSLSFELAPEHAHGQYQGMFTTSIQLSSMLAPAAGTALVLGLGATGWLVMAAVMLTAGTACTAVARMPGPDRDRAVGG